MGEVDKARGASAACASHSEYIYGGTASRLGVAGASKTGGNSSCSATQTVKERRSPQGSGTPAHSFPRRNQGD